MNATTLPTQATFVHLTLTDGEVYGVIAYRRRTHRELLRLRLIADGIDESQAQALTLDAVETYSSSYNPKHVGTVIHY